ncbi:MAG: DUF1330 domain-containing protein [Myxococcales bacterium]|nr:DUF1330 domain-containing protein [Myxococcales bacterium]
MHLHPNRQAFAALLQSSGDAPVVMANLLRFRDVADYANTPELAPDSPISGAEAYRRYAAHAMPFLAEAGSRVLFDGAGGDTLIGPVDERWHRVLLVEHRSASDFVAFATNEAYLEGLGHRTAALADSRLIPVTAAPRS